MCLLGSPCNRPVHVLDDTAQDKGGVFVVTPNDYLARRDAENVGQVLRFLGVSVGLVQSTMEVLRGDK